MFYEEIRVKQSLLYYYSTLFMKDPLQEQIHFNGNIFGNKCCWCNEISLYSHFLSVSLSLSVCLSVSLSLSLSLSLALVKAFFFSNQKEMIVSQLCCDPLVKKGGCQFLVKECVQV